MQTNPLVCIYLLFIFPDFPENLVDVNHHMHFMEVASFWYFIQKLLTDLTIKFELPLYGNSFFSADINSCTVFLF